MKRLYPILGVLILALIFSGTAIAGKVHKMSIEEASAIEILPDDNADFDAGPARPYQGSDVTDSPGLLVGTTYYDYQTNGSSGNRISKHECGIHMCWMNGIGSWQGNRYVYYNFLDNNRNLGWSGGIGVSSEEGAGYTNLDNTADGRAVVAFHNSNNLGMTVATDPVCGVGAFILSNVPDQYPGEEQFFWPYIAVDGNDNYQIVGTENEPAAGDPQMVGHTISSDEGGSWSELLLFGELMDISEIVVASHTDNKVAIVYTFPIDDGGEPTQYNNDVCYIESEDGTTWDYDSYVNVTNYEYDDTIRAYTDLDAVYDMDGNLHILWNAPGYFAEDGTITVDACFMYHWSEATGITMVYNAWHPSFPGAWNRSASKMSLAICGSAPEVVYALWTHFDDMDVSGGGWSNGELYLASSTDYGETWSEPINVTDSYSGDCMSEDCDSDHWSSMAEVADDSVYILYINDKDAGGMPQTEGTQTENPVLYLAVSEPTSICSPISVDDEVSVPSVFELAQNYPNPFNANTNISFNLDEASNVSLEVFNILGEKVTTLIDGKLAAGEHTMSWDAAKYTSGVYMYKLSANGVSETRRMVLLK
ncbi:MAG: T9SS type A sorting domain-containing protein [candidate division Zixibacteria bacterium]|nr:T9SS type A sorting domain-containing protein [candidate division Zixibacteria bacterium]